VQLHYLDFSPTGELFVPDAITGHVHRFLFDGTGTAIPNGSLFLPFNPIGTAFSPEGELFVSFHHTGGMRRFLFDSAGNAVPNGFIPTDTLGDVAIFDPSAVPEPATFLLLLSAVPTLATWGQNWKKFRK
jgi:hypothetical protein